MLAARLQAMVRGLAETGCMTLMAIVDAALHFGREGSFGFEHCGKLLFSGRPAGSLVQLRASKMIPSHFAAIFDELLLDEGGSFRDLGKGTGDEGTLPGLRISPVSRKGENGEHH